MTGEAQAPERIRTRLSSFGRKSDAVDPRDEEALIKAWSHDADFMKTQPGYISTQLHKGIGGSGAYINYAIWESVEAFRNAFTNPEFQRRIGDYSESVVASPHLFKKLSVENHCTE